MPSPLIVEIWSVIMLALGIAPGVVIFLLELRKRRVPLELNDRRDMMSWRNATLLGIIIATAILLVCGIGTSLTLLTGTTLGAVPPFAWRRY